jgi:predicted metalloprotease
MRWEDERRSDNIEDRRGMSFGGPGIQLGGLGLVVVLVVSFFTGISPSTLLDMIQGAAPPQQQVQRAPTGAPAANDKQADFVAAILGSTEDTWSRIFAEHNARYQAPRLVLFTGATPSACGTGRAAMGPFYCPQDRKVYIDLSFFRELSQRFGAPGDFARAYVVAHEVGHHVQNLIGTFDRVEHARVAGQRGAGSLQVRLELQADCYAGVWAHNANQWRHLLEPGDIEEGLRAAAAIGDDTLQKETQGRVAPESWTHGSSAQRVRWFTAGYESGRIESCNTFKAAQL